MLYWVAGHFFYYSHWLKQVTDWNCNFRTRGTEEHASRLYRLKCFQRKLLFATATQHFVFPNTTHNHNFHFREHVVLR